MSKLLFDIFFSWKLLFINLHFKWKLLIAGFISLQIVLIQQYVTTLKKSKHTQSLLPPAKADLHSSKVWWVESECATCYVRSRPQGDETPVWQLCMLWSGKVLTNKPATRMRRYWSLIFLERLRLGFFFNSKVDYNPKIKPHGSHRETNYYLEALSVVLAVLPTARLAEGREISKSLPESRWGEVPASDHPGESLVLGPEGLMSLWRPCLVAFTDIAQKTHELLFSIYSILRSHTWLFQLKLLWAGWKTRLFPSTILLPEHRLVDIYPAWPLHPGARRIRHLTSGSRWMCIRWQCSF